MASPTICIPALVEVSAEYLWLLSSKWRQISLMATHTVHVHSRVLMLMLVCIDGVPLCVSGDFKINSFT